MEWLNDNAQAISAVASICTLFVWVFYAQLLYNGYVRQRRPRVIINRGKGIGVDSICLISNMSSEAIYVQHLVAVLFPRRKKRRRISLLSIMAGQWKLVLTSAI